MNILKKIFKDENAHIIMAIVLVILAFASYYIFLTHDDDELKKQGNPEKYEQIITKQQSMSKNKKNITQSVHTESNQKADVHILPFVAEYDKATGENAESASLFTNEEPRPVSQR